MLAWFRGPMLAWFRGPMIAWFRDPMGHDCLNWGFMIAWFRGPMTAWFRGPMIAWPTDLWREWRWSRGSRWRGCQMCRGGGRTGAPGTCARFAAFRIPGRLCTQGVTPGLWIRIRIRIGSVPYSIGSLDPDPDPYSEYGSGSGSRRAKMTQKSRQ